VRHGPATKRIELGDGEHVARLRAGADGTSFGRRITAVRIPDVDFEASGEFAASRVRESGMARGVCDVPHRLGTLTIGILQGRPRRRGASAGTSASQLPRSRGRATGRAARRAVRPRQSQIGGASGAAHRLGPGRRLEGREEGVSTASGAGGRALVARRRSRLQRGSLSIKAVHDATSRGGCAAARGSARDRPRMVAS